jgi:hypothetical protein
MNKVINKLLMEHAGGESVTFTIEEDGEFYILYRQRKVKDITHYREVVFKTDSLKEILARAQEVKLTHLAMKFKPKTSEFINVFFNE